MTALIIIALFIFLFSGFILNTLKLMGMAIKAVLFIGGWVWGLSLLYYAIHYGS
jgi:hypothetical protein